MTDKSPGDSRIKRFEVKGLFGTFDHKINLNLGDRITIVHGPNGFGKTVLLQMLHNMLRNNFSRLRQIPFLEFVVTFESGDEVHVRKKPANGSLPENIPPTLQFRLVRERKMVETYDLPPNSRHEDLPFPIGLIEHEIEELDQIDAEHWLHGPTGRILRRCT
jgi:hypothetical protein